MMRHWSGALPSTMLVYIIRRLMQAALVMVVMSALVFAGIFVIGDPVAMLISPDAERDRARAVRAALGLDLPMWQQYLVFVAERCTAISAELPGRPAGHGTDLRAHAGDPGTGHRLADPVAADRPADGRLCRPEAALAGHKAIMTGSILGFSLPNFWVGLMLIMVFAVCCPTSAGCRAAGLGPRRRPSTSSACRSRSS